jgi:hypothetical protein
MKYIKPYDNFITENAITQIAIPEVLPGTNKATVAEEPVELETEVQNKNESN